MTVRILVLSDLHAHTRPPDGGGATHLSYHGSAEGVEKLLGGLKSTLEREGIHSVDVVVVPGDLADKCDPTALPKVWADICALAEHLNAKLVATAGNHDHNRRNGEPASGLKALRPEFPTRDAAGRLSYFCDDIAEILIDDTLFVTLNSASLTAVSRYDSDAVGAEAVVQDDMGYFTEAARARLVDLLAANSGMATGVLVVHHHPVQLPTIDQNEASLIRGAHELLRMLESHGDWLIIHGHKHRPYIHYGPGGGGSPVLFSAGSFSAALDGVLAQSTKNQFYLVDLDSLAARASIALGLTGRFRAWSHSPLEPSVWVPSGRTDGIPAIGGFGWRTSPSALAAMLIGHSRETTTGLTASQLGVWEPRLAYIDPATLTRAVELVNATPDVRLKLSESGQIESLDYLGGAA